jgi:hypothetical protein
MIRFGKRICLAAMLALLLFLMGIPGPLLVMAIPCRYYNSTAPICRAYAWSHYYSSKEPNTCGPQRALTIPETIRTSFHRWMCYQWISAADARREPELTLRRGLRGEWPPIISLRPKRGLIASTASSDLGNATTAVVAESR